MLYSIWSTIQNNDAAQKSADMASSTLDKIAGLMFPWHAVKVGGPERDKRDLNMLEKVMGMFGMTDALEKKKKSQGVWEQMEENAKKGAPKP